ncbi:hypothetical protein HBI56_195350 [Parastagonospora nodorum]|nr:hypothetical protein HBH56_207030 [Parastagonospora nodorum]KAH3923794.1 hypothetical protein HBH54_205900 [Parastagonospora nodorum]KAH3942325.1 hypothetical protein HBH53_188470 [Parastagonospora nodorum]KAH4129732.1 hypothetical protein HBH45_204030 [Parastagonospora nodorum]KAH4149680.1 hypothetical protein HBH44_193240 [Parastagonospora nodorum]
MGTASPAPADYASCIDACAATTGCRAVSYIPNGPCYLKSALGQPNQNGNVWGASLQSASSSSSASSSQSATPATSASSAAASSSATSSALSTPTFTSASRVVERTFKRIVERTFRRIVERTFRRTLKRILKRIVKYIVKRIHEQNFKRTLNCIVQCVFLECDFQLILAEPFIDPSFIKHTNIFHYFKRTS